MESKLKKLNQSAPPFFFISANDFPRFIENQKATATQTHFNLKASAAPFIPQNPGKLHCLLKKHYYFSVLQLRQPKKRKSKKRKRIKKKT